MYQAVQWGFPVGFDVQVHSLGMEYWPDHDVPKIDASVRWPERPETFRTLYELAEKIESRPRNTLQPDALAITPGRQVTFEGTTRTTYRTVPLYDQADTVPLRQLPRPEDVAYDRNIAISWAQMVLADPTTVILAINTIGNTRPKTPIEKRPTLCEIALLQPNGHYLLDSPINPAWEDMRGQRLRRLGLSGPQLRAVYPYWECDSEILALLEGRRIVCADRAFTYGVLFSDNELSEDGIYYPNGLLHEDTARVLDLMGFSRWDCLRLSSSLFGGQWYEGRFPAPVLRELPPPRPARVQVVEMLRQIEHMAKSTPAQRISPMFRQRVASRKGVRKYYVRDPEKRDLVISLSGGRCENTKCEDIGYLADTTPDGQPLLEVDHIIPLGRGGPDDPFNMIALCANCHDRKTRGSKALSFIWEFQQMIGPKRRLQIRG